MRILALILLLTATTSCLYKMPNDDTISTLPNTNNPNLTREQPIQYLPS